MNVVSLHHTPLYLMWLQSFQTIFGSQAFPTLFWYPWSDSSDQTFLRDLKAVLHSVSSGLFEFKLWSSSCQFTHFFEFMAYLNSGGSTNNLVETAAMKFLSVTWMLIVWITQILCLWHHLLFLNGDIDSIVRKQYWYWIPLIKESTTLSTRSTITAVLQTVTGL